MCKKYVFCIMEFEKSETDAIGHSLYSSMLNLSQADLKQNNMWQCFFA